jgi:hypothetical protein
MFIKLRGTIEFSPEDRTKKQKNQSAWKRVAIIKTNCDLSNYYAWFLEKRFNLKLNQNIRGTHITFISDKMEKTIFDECSKFFNGKEIDFYLNLEPKSDGKYWWLDVISPDSENIRKVCGLTPEPYFPFHLTLGLANEKNIEFSNYILNQCKLYNLIEFEKVSTLDESKVLDFSKNIF